MTEVHADSPANQFDESLQLVAGAALAFVDFNELDGTAVKDNVAYFEIDLLVLEALDALDPSAIADVFEDAVDHAHDLVGFDRCHCCLIFVR